MTSQKESKWVFCPQQLQAWLNEKLIIIPEFISLKNFSQNFLTQLLVISETVINFWGKWQGKNLTTAWYGNLTLFYRQVSCSRLFLIMFLQMLLHLFEPIDMPQLQDLTWPSIHSMFSHFLRNMFLSVYSIDSLMEWSFLFSVWFVSSCFPFSISFSFKNICPAPESRVWFFHIFRE